jgi:myo-inositol-1-phosphate synthase
LRQQSSRTGVWFIGARGSVATTAMTGIAVLAEGGPAAEAGRIGLVTASPRFAKVALPEFDELVAGGHDVAAVPLVKRAEALVEAGVLPYGILTDAVRHRLDQADGNVRPGLDPSSTEPGQVGVHRIARDLASFRAANDLDTVVVVNVSSTERPAAPHPAHDSLPDLMAALAADQIELPASTLYALAAFETGCAWVDFTPSTGADLPALRELARDRGVVHAGKDGKTGETLLKSALAPMFAGRNLRVLAWSGTNLLGGGDGGSLHEPERRQSKLDSKNVGLHAILGYEPAGPTHIDNVPAMGEWKTAWDHIEFSGFLGTRMRMQFTWQGCDSALAAPLVIDLVRLASAAQRAGRRGALGELGYFFKDPQPDQPGHTEHALDRQFDQLCAWAETLPEV